MSFNNRDESTDIPSTSKSSFLKQYPLKRQNIQPLTMRTLSTEIIDLSADDRKQVLHTFNGNCSTLTIKSNKTSTQNVPKDAKRLNAKKILSMLNEPRKPSLIDLTDENSTKSSNRKKISPVNSLEKIPDTEPNCIVKLDADRKQKKKETERVKRDDNNNNNNLLLEEKFKNCKITEDDPDPAFPDFTSQQEAKITEALKPRNANRIIVEKFNLRITGQDLKRFNEKEWLNDEVINFYLNMIQERSQNSNLLPKVYSFSTFFYPKLVSSGYSSSIRRWTKRVDIFSYDVIVVPVHLGCHWCIAIIDFRDKSIRYYDSMLGKKNVQCLNALAQYLAEEHRDKKQSEYDVSGWTKVIMKDIPRQGNGSDCGVFCCTFAELITRNAQIRFTQEHVPYIRRKMVIEIVEGRLLT